MSDELKMLEQDLADEKANLEMLEDRLNQLESDPTMVNQDANSYLNPKQQSKIGKTAMAIDASKNRVMNLDSEIADLQRKEVKRQSYELSIADPAKTIKQGQSEKKAAIQKIAKLEKLIPKGQAKLEQLTADGASAETLEKAQNNEAEALDNLASATVEGEPEAISLAEKLLQEARSALAVAEREHVSHERFVNAIRKEVDTLTAELENAKQDVKDATAKIAMGIRSKLVPEWDKHASEIAEIGRLIAAAESKAGIDSYWASDLAITTFDPDFRNVSGYQVSRYKTTEFPTVEELLKAFNKRDSLLTRAAKVVA